MSDILHLVTTISALVPGNQPSPMAGRWVTLLLELTLLPGFAVGLERIFPHRLEIVRATATHFWPLSAAWGALCWVVGLSAIVVVGYTLILLPVSVLAFCLMLFAATIGAAAHARKLGSWLLTKVSISAGQNGQTLVGMILLIGMLELLRCIPLVGGILIILLMTTALGATLITRFGTAPFILDESETC